MLECGKHHISIMTNNYMQYRLDHYIMYHPLEFPFIYDNRNEQYIFILDTGGEQYS